MAQRAPIGRPMVGASIVESLRLVPGTVNKAPLRHRRNNKPPPCARANRQACLFSLILFLSLTLSPFCLSLSFSFFLSLFSSVVPSSLDLMVLSFFRAIFSSLPFFLFLFSFQLLMIKYIMELSSCEIPANLRNIVSEDVTEFTDNVLAMCKLIATILH